MSGRYGPDYDRKMMAQAHALAEMLRENQLSNEEVAEFRRVVDLGWHPDSVLVPTLLVAHGHVARLDLIEGATRKRFRSVIWNAPARELREALIERDHDLELLPPHLRSKSAS